MILTMTNTKGGVGKTSLAANLCGWFADQGQRVLAVDADPQPTLSSWYPLRQQAPNGLHRLITRGDAAKTISHTVIPGLDLIYSDDPKGSLATFLRQAPDGPLRLEHALRPLRAAYDVMVIDTQGAVSPLLDAAILAGDRCLSPIRPDRVSAAEFHRGSLRIVSEQRTLGARLGRPVGPLLAVLYGIRRTRDARNYAEAVTKWLSSENPQSLVLLQTRIPATAAYAAAATQREPVHRTDRRTRGRTPCAAEIMATLAAEIQTLTLPASMEVQA